MATSVNISAWRDEVAKYTKEINTTEYQAILDGEIVETIRDFCKETHLWTQDLDPISVIANRNNYTLFVDDTDGKANIIVVQSVHYKEDGESDDQFRALDVISDWRSDQPQEIPATYHDPVYGNWRFETSEYPTNFYVKPSKELILYPIPTVKSDHGLRVNVVLKPEDGATKVPIWIYQDYKQAIAWGAAGSILGMTTQKWFDADLSEYFLGKYRHRRNAAKIRRQEGYGMRKSKVLIPDIAGSRNKFLTTY